MVITIVFTTFIRTTEEIIINNKYEGSRLMPGDLYTYMEGICKVVDAFIEVRCMEENNLDIDRFWAIKVTLGEHMTVSLETLIMNQMRLLVPDSSYRMKN